MVNRIIIEIAKKIKNAGGTAFYVGGRNRDLLLGKDMIKDIDIEVFGLEKEKLENILNEINVEINFVGKHFGVYKVKGYNIDISLPRKEVSTGPGHKDFKIIIDPYISVEEACERRDFTINAILIDILTGEIIDPFNGVEDIKNKIIRSTNEKAFIEDPLRVYRAIQFAARFNFKIEEKTKELCKKIDLSSLPKERVYEELKKMLLKSQKPSIGLNYMKELKVIKYFPLLENLINCPQDPLHHPEGDVWNHTLLVVDEAAKVKHLSKNPEVFMFAALLHDIGKPETTIVKEGKVTSYNHDKKGEEIAIDFLKDNKKIINEISILIKYHMQPIMFYNNKNQIKDSAFRRLATKVDLKELSLLSMCDRLGRKNINREKELKAVKWFNDKCNELNILKQRPEPIVTGKDLIKLGLKPGPIFGKILKKAFDLQMEGLSKKEILNELNLI